VGWSTFSKVRQAALGHSTHLTLYRTSAFFTSSINCLLLPAVVSYVPLYHDLP
jgi:hypothetical protein